ncbi:MAG: HAD family hydrolase [Clostridia bacterium]|nr:HAD family hydrolase [Clostridia bacterium]
MMAMWTIKGNEEKIKWIFFDVGSTLVDESDCYQYRIDEIVMANRMDHEEFVSCVKRCAKENAFPIKAAAQKYGVSVPPWRCELEKLYPCTKELLKRLSEQYHLGIIANQEPGTQSRLENWGIKNDFDVIIASAESGFSKPDLRIFEIALRQAACEPNNAVMVGDRLDNDILPAKQLGMKTVWVRQGFARYQPNSDMPDHTIQTLEEIERIL